MEPIVRVSANASRHVAYALRLRHGFLISTFLLRSLAIKCLRKP